MKQTKVSEVFQIHHKIVQDTDGTSITVLSQIPSMRALLKKLIRNVVECLILLHYILNVTSIKKATTYPSSQSLHIQRFSSGSSSSLSSLLVPALQKRHLQHTMQGAARSNSGDATSKRIPKPANMPMT